MWAWILGAVGVLGIGGTIAVVFLFPTLAPKVLEWMVGVMAWVMREAATAASWCLRQIMDCPAWTGVLVALAVVAWCWSGNVGYGRGDTAGYAHGMAAGLAADAAKIKDVQGRLDTCRTSNTTLETAIKDRNGQILALSAQGAALKAESADKVAKAQDEMKALRTRLAALTAAKPAGKDECARAISARAQIIEDRSK